MTVFFPAPDLCPLTYFLVFPSTLPLPCIPLLPSFPLTSRPSRIVNIEDPFPSTRFGISEKRTGEIVLLRNSLQKFQFDPSIHPFISFVAITFRRFSFLDVSLFFFVARVRGKSYPIERANWLWLAFCISFFLFSFFLFSSFSSFSVDFFVLLFADKSTV